MGSGTDTLLIAVDFSAGSKKAVGAAKALAADLNARVVLVHAFGKPVGKAAAAAANRSGGGRQRALGSAQLEEITTKLEPAANELRDLGLDVQVVARPGAPAIVILEEAKRHKASLIAMGAHGAGGLARLFIGSVAKKVIQGAAVPVLVTPLGMKGHGGRKAKADAVPKLAVAVDFSPESAAALQAATRLAQDLKASLLLVHAVQVPLVAPGYPEAVAAYTPDMLARDSETASIEATAWAERARSAGIEVDTTLAVGEPATSILAEARHAAAALIVVGTRGQTGLRRFFMGSVAQNVVRHADRPVLVVPPGLAKRTARGRAKSGTAKAKPVTSRRT